MAAPASKPTRGSGKPDIAEAITISLLRVINKIQQGRRVPRDYGAGVSMTLLEAEMCALIARHDGVTGSELSDELAVTRSATSQIISKLKGKGLVTERASEVDAKRKQLSLTPHGHDAAAIADNFKAAMSDAVRRFGQGAATAGDVAVRLAALPDEPVSLSLAGMRGLGEAAVLLGLTDSTEEARLKRQIAQATKMQAVGQLAGGVAHDFNNVLTAIIGTCDLMLLRHTPGDSDYDDIQQIRASSNRAASLTRQLLAFSRQQT